MSKLRIGILIALTALLLFVAIWIDREDRVVDDMDPMNIIYKSHLDTVGNDDE